MLLFSLLPFLASVSAEECPNGATYDQTYQRCLLIIPEKSFYKAELNCIKLGGHLVTIRNFQENTDVANYIKDNVCCSVWIGHDQSGKWQDGQNVTFTFFAGGQPAPAFRCVQLDPSLNDRWRSANCSHKVDAVCSLPPHSPQRCPDGWSYFRTTNACYKNYLDSPNVNWVVADQRCRAIGAQLTRIDSVEENHFVSVLSASSLSRLDLQDNTWIGMRLFAPNNTQRWTDNLPVKFTNFAPGEPNGNNNECVMMVTNFNFHKRLEFGQWYDQQCNQPMNGYVCKMIAK